jgi:hypothetical protein
MEDRKKKRDDGDRCEIVQNREEAHAHTPKTQQQTE